uniref:Protein tyrosine phosphatase receptor type G n=1 Tax=Varanus komodoensis TaxID=61221 RepID=A0A8D2LIA1_VARKO
MRRLLQPCCWIFFLKITISVLHYVVCFPALTEGYDGSLHESRHGSSVQIRRRKASGDLYWAYSVGKKEASLCQDFQASIAGQKSHQPQF